LQRQNGSNYFVPFLNPDRRREATLNQKGILRVGRRQKLGQVGSCGEKRTSRERWGFIFIGKRKNFLKSTPRILEKEGVRGRCSHRGGFAKKTDAPGSRFEGTRGGKRKTLMSVSGRTHGKSREREKKRTRNKYSYGSKQRNEGEHHRVREVVLNDVEMHCRRKT